MVDCIWDILTIINVVPGGLQQTICQNVIFYWSRCQGLHDVLKPSGFCQKHTFMFLRSSLFFLYIMFCKVFCSSLFLNNSDNGFPVFAKLLYFLRLNFTFTKTPGAKSYHVADSRLNHFVLIKSAWMDANTCVWGMDYYLHFYYHSWYIQWFNDIYSMKCLGFWKTMI